MQRRITRLRQSRYTEGLLPRLNAFGFMLLAESELSLLFSRQLLVDDSSAGTDDTIDVALDSIRIPDWRWLIVEFLVVI